eukprot:6275842-Amphidinium_carterae.1
MVWRSASAKKLLVSYSNSVFRMMLQISSRVLLILFLLPHATMHLCEVLALPVSIQHWTKAISIRTHESQCEPCTQRHQYIRVICMVEDNLKTHTGAMWPATKKPKVCGSYCLGVRGDWHQLGDGHSCSDHCHEQSGLNGATPTAHTHA